MEKKLTLYHYYRSSCSWRVRWALNLKGLTYDSISINLLRDEHQSQAYIRHNPSAQVPTLKIGEQSFAESVAILEWLEESYPCPPLLPQDPLSRLRVRQLVQIVSSGTQPLQNLAPQRYYSQERSEQLAFARHWIDKGLRAYESLLDDGLGGSYSFGGELTMADLCLIPQGYNALRFGLDLAAYPQIARIYHHCLQSKACQESAPERFAI